MRQTLGLNQMEKIDLQNVLKKHCEWLNTGIGEKLNLSGSNLSGADLSWADLSMAKYSHKGIEAKRFTVLLNLYEYTTIFRNRYIFKKTSRSWSVYVYSDGS